MGPLKGAIQIKAIIIIVPRRHLSSTFSNIHSKIKTIKLNFTNLNLITQTLHLHNIKHSKSTDYSICKSYCILIKTILPFRSTLKPPQNNNGHTDLGSKIARFTLHYLCVFAYIHTYVIAHTMSATVVWVWIRPRRFAAYVSLSVIWYVFEQGTNIQREHLGDTVTLKVKKSLSIRPTMSEIHVTILSPEWLSELTLD